MSRMKKIGRGMALVLVGMILIASASFLVWRELGIRSVAEDRMIKTEDGIAVLEKVRIGGIDQWISIRGRHRSNPVILYLHGGPGFPMMPFAHSFQTPWEEHFTVVQWDQRGTGKTYNENDPAVVLPTMSHERMLEDAHELTLMLRKRFQTDRIFVLGHSWGSMLGIPLVKRYPELFYAYIGTGQVINVMENERVGYQRTLMIANQQNNAIAVAELKSIAPYPNPATGTSAPRKVLRKWQRELGLGVRGKSDSQIMAEMLSYGLKSPDYSLGDNLVWIRRLDSTFSRDALSGEIDRFDVNPLGYDFQIPVIFMLGRHDWQVPSTIAAEYFGKVNAPYKKLIWFETSAHSPPSEEPDLFQQMLVREVLPLAKPRPVQAASQGAGK